MERYIIEFLTIFLGVISAFALNNWTDRRKSKVAKVKILTEISNGLEKDIDDININMAGHNKGIAAVAYFQKIVLGEKVPSNEFVENYTILTRDFVSLYNDSGYTSLKSKGLEIIKDDVIRKKIISLYEYDYTLLAKLEEEYGAMQFYRNYYDKINNMLSSSYIFNKEYALIGIKLPVQLTAKDKNLFLTYLNNIKYNRHFILRHYEDVKRNTKNLKDDIQRHLK